MRRALRCALVLAFCAGCSEKPGPAQEKPGASAAPTALAPAPSNGAPTVPSGKTEAPAPSASAAEAPAGTNALAGTWEGRYEAKKGEVEMPPKVKDKVRAKDDGKTAIGPGKVTITIGPDGELFGKTEGALGEAMLKGKAEGEDVRGMFLPDDPLSKQAMFGILEGKRKDDHISARIRVSSGDASVVREAEIDLKKK